VCPGDGDGECGQRVMRTAYSDKLAKHDCIFKIMLMMLLMWMMIGQHVRRSQELGLL
jgi:hypothetical protein